MKKCFEEFVKNENGDITVIVTFFIISMMICLGMTIDIGNTHLQQLRMRNAVDLATASIAAQMPVEYTEDLYKGENLQLFIEDIIQQNGINLSDVNLSIEPFKSPEHWLYASRIIMDQQLFHYFGGLYTKESSTIRVGNLAYVLPETVAGSGYTILIYDS